MNLRIIKAGILDTVQDQGRYGWQHLGINPAGAMDRFAAQLANLLVGNDAFQPTIELHFPAAAFFFEQAALIAVCGADFNAAINGEDIEPGRPVLVSKYSILQFQALRKGARAYLAIEGGLKINPWLNSYSTHLKAQTGGLHGRPLQTDDEIRMASSCDWAPYLRRKEFRILPWQASSDWDRETGNEIKILPGREWDRLTESSKQLLITQPFTLLPQSDRMGYRLRSEPLALADQQDMISTVVSFGTVQLLPDGQLIILMADHQTTGGYPRIAHVISAHHSRLAQVGPGEPIRFRFTDQRSAEALFIQQQRHLLQLGHACKLKLEQFLHAVH